MTQHHKVPALEVRVKAHAEFMAEKSVASRKDVVDRISSAFGVTKSTVYQWYKGTTPFGSRAGRITVVPELLYVLGALLGDGCIYKWRNHFQVWLVGEEAFTAKFALMLSRCVGREVKNHKYGSKNAWFVRIDNAELFYLLQSVRRDHSLIQELVERVDPQRGWVRFVEGFFDAEGCVKIIGGRERRTPKACLDFCNTDLDLLCLVQGALRKMGFKASITSQKADPPRRTSYHLRIYSKAGIAGFLTLIATTKLTEKKKPLVEAWLTKGVEGKRLTWRLSRALRPRQTN